MKVVIIGAGVAGLATGWRLLQAGCQVVLLDRGRPGGGASWAAAGMLALTAEMESAGAAERALAASSAAQWPAFAEELEKASGQTIGYRRDGALILAADAAALAAMRHRGPVLDGAAVRGMVPLLADQPGGLWIADEAHVDNRALGVALIAAVLNAGGTILSNEAAVRIEAQASRATAVLTPYGRHAADVFLLAAGAWSGLLDDIPITPVKGEMIALKPPPGTPLPGPVVWGAGVYLVPRNGRLLAGATVEAAGFDTAPTQSARDFLSSRAQSLIPSLSGWTLDAHWAGLRPKSPDGLPLLGPTALPNLFIAGGQYRNGILFAPAVAQMMADMMLGRAAAVPAFDPLRFSGRQS